ncbi:MAG: roadblock/LC7 domain-containing protein [Rhodanobacteraceae bacterium]|nr:roadblock/LC7 domain-containing protein [Xanthomonadales bacterium]MCP5477777.1 roadblock/LC7 domain-containing protein [Rhodanobacteraceae bacterium]HPF73072.1 roadblock/LC7 domain-containing protein [Xanthomonadaceae bacterium]HRX99624.1 roadblock/LC7 domain-containing protein [Xanthomonadaceae bacterium]
MAKVSLEPLRSMDGYVASALVDADSGMMLAGDGAGVNLEVAAAGNSEVVRAKRKVANNLKLNDTIEDILISLTKQYHIIRPLESAQQLFLYVVLDRGKANLAMARHEIRTFEKSLDFG